MPSYGETRYLCFSISCQYRIKRLTSFKVEYLVVTYSEDDPHVLLSLRQADILNALASDASLSAKGGCVPALQDVPGSK